MAAVDTGASGNLWLFPEGDLLTGTNARATITETCPTIGAAASVSGRLGQDWTGRLSGSASVKAVLTHSSNGLYAGSYFTPRVGPYHLDLTRGLRGGYVCLRAHARCC